MNILILGAGGLAGAAIRRKLNTSDNRVYGTCRTLRGDAGLRRYVLEEGGLMALLQETAPETVISCLRGNFGRQLEAHRIAAAYLAERGGRMLYLSTANVFDGEVDRPHDESDPPCAGSDYGRFKIACERLLTEILGARAVILRPPEIWGRNAPRLQALKEADLTGGAVQVYDNVRINYTTDHQVAEWVDYILRRNLEGIFHVGTRDECTHGAFRRRLAEAMGLERIRWEAERSVGCQTVRTNRKEIPEELHATVDDVLTWLTAGV